MLTIGYMTLGQFLNKKITEKVLLEVSRKLRIHVTSFSSLTEEHSEYWSQKQWEHPFQIV